MKGTDSLDRLSVALATQGQVVEKVVVGSDGSFAFHSIPEGTYEARVLNLHGGTLWSEHVTLSSAANTLTLEVPEPVAPKPLAGVISVRQLVPDKARKEMVRSEQAFRKGKLDESIRRLEKAIRICPSYMEAHNNLGSRMMWKKDYERAAAEFLIATELDGSAGETHANLALALIALKRYPEAAQAARRSLEVAPDYLPARYALGLTDAALNHCTAEAAENLKKAGERYPRARLAAARILACRGETAEAEAQLRAYHDATAQRDQGQPEGNRSSGFAGGGGL